MADTKTGDTKKTKYRIQVKKQDRNRAFVVTLDNVKYCVYGWDYLTEKEKKVIKKDVPEKILGTLFERGYQSIKKV